MSYNYALKYKLKMDAGTFSREDIQKDPDDGGCDAIFGASLLYPPDGTFSVLFFSKDGRTNSDLADEEWFKVWSMLTQRLATSKTLSEQKKSFCASVFDVIRNAVAGPAKDEKRIITP
jgi:hypothetical protein